MTAALVQPDIQIVDVSPDTAKEWLNANTHNRPLRTTNINRYARDMGTGRWNFNGEPIQFDTTGRILNGQHRLHAVIQSGTTQKFLVIRNLSPEAQETMDSGAKRTPGDVLSLAGFENSKILASVARLALQLEASPNVVVMQRGYTTAEIKSRIERDPSLITVATDVVPALPKQNIMPNASLTYCYYRLAQLNPEKTREFFNGLLTLVNLPEGSPILALHRRLTQLSASRSKTTSHQFEVVALVFQAWNAWRRNELRTLIRNTTDDSGRLKVPSPV